MATAFLASVEDLAHAREIEMRINNGEMPEPPASKQVKRNTCDECGALTVLRYDKSGALVCFDCNEKVAE